MRQKLQLIRADLAFQAYPQAARPLLERTLTTFKDIADRLANMRTLKATREIGDRRQLARWMRPYLRNDDLIGVRVNNQIGVVRDHNYLTFVLGFPEQAHELIEDRLGVQVFFRLVDDKGPIIGIVERKVQKQQHDPSCARRQLTNINAVVVDAVLDCDVFGTIEPLRKTLQPRAIVRLVSLGYGRAPIGLPDSLSGISPWLR
jgi:hypothetical protein